MTVPRTIRERVLTHLKAATSTFHDETCESGEVFYYVGGKSWPTFVREINRMERDGLITFEWSGSDECFIGLPEVVPFAGSATETNTP